VEEEEERLRALLRRRAEKEAVVEKERLEHEQKSKSILEALSKVGGKEILLDANGRPIPVVHVEVEKVPSKFVAPKTVCLEPPKDKGEAKTKHSSPKADVPMSSAFTPMGTAQPSAMETLGDSGIMHVSHAFQVGFQRRAQTCAIWMHTSRLL
jgi:hypothetical protein